MSVWRPRHATPALAGVLLCTALLLGGCAATPQLAQLERQWPAQLPDRVLLDRVPFHPQDDHLCGPATLARGPQPQRPAATASSTRRTTALFEPDDSAPQAPAEAGPPGALSPEVLPKMLPIMRPLARSHHT